MKLKELSKEELESMGYDDIAYQILVETNKKIKLPDLFKKVCDLLDLSQAEYENKIADFFQLISNDQRFTMLDKGYWDLKEKHKANIIMENDEDEIEESEDDIDLSEEEDEEAEYYDEDSDDDDVEDDDLKDLVIVSDDDDEANVD